MPDDSGRRTFHMVTDAGTIQALLRERVSAERYAHILAVASLAATLSRDWGIDEDRARRAALLHDFAREMTELDLLQAAIDGGLPVTTFERDHPGLLHGPVAAYVAAREFGLDPEACAAIAVHTVGRAGMQTFDLLLFVADHAAEGRRGDGPPRWREMARSNLVDTAREIMDDVIKRSVKRGYAIAPVLVEARNDLLHRQREAMVQSSVPTTSHDRAAP